MDVVGTVTALVGAADVAARAGVKVYQLIQAWKNIPAEFSQLQDELLKTSTLYEKIHIMAQIPWINDIQPLLQSSLIDELASVQHILTEITDIAEHIQRRGKTSSLSPRGVPHRSRWLQEQTKIKYLQKRLQATQSRVMLTLVSLSAARSYNIPPVVLIPPKVPDYEEIYDTVTSPNCSLSSPDIASKKRDTCTASIARRQPDGFLVETKSELNTSPNNQNIGSLCSLNGSGNLEETAQPPQTCQTAGQSNLLLTSATNQDQSAISHGPHGEHAAFRLLMSPYEGQTSRTRVPIDAISLDAGIFGKARANQIKAVKNILNQSPTAVLDIREDDGASALLYAALRSQFDIVKVLLQAGADVHQPDDNGRTPFQYLMRVMRRHKLADSEDTRTIFELLGYDLVQGFLDALPSLHKIVLGILPLDLQAALLSPELASQVGTRDDLNESALDLAATMGDVEAVEALLKAGASPNTGNNPLDSPLKRVSQNGHYAVADTLIRWGGNLDFRDSSRFTAAHDAAKHGCMATLRTLVAAGADVQAVDIFGYTPLLWAAQSGHEEMTRYLLDRGSDIDHRDWEGDCALSLTVGRRETATARMLLRRRPGADYRCVNDHGLGVLHHLALWGNSEIMRMFAAHGMHSLNLTREDARGRTPLQLFNARVDLDAELRCSFDVLLESVDRANREHAGLAGENGLNSLF
ncbi:ankyrin repeat-containing domain protein [Xylariaceae sp. FL1651]|nr:ankyrin repeat-containing domain protein [Xylariaceae sp. FL1651]